MVLRCGGFVSSEDSSPPAEEAEVVRRIVAGERELFRSLVDAHETAIYRMIRRQLSDEQAARDLTQETFLRAYRGLAKFRGGSSLRTWFIRIALNVTASYFASRAFKDSARTESGVDQELLAAAEPDAAPFSEEELRALRTAIAGLKDRYREVIVLCGLEGKSYREASEILEIPLGTVCSRMNSANHQLRIKLKKVRR